jgi:catechol 2,3-dioxygenase-like lactoylglutathione lyase family enzyme
MISTEPIHDLAHVAHAELLTPYPDESLRFFVEQFGMEVEHRQGQSEFLRGWDEYQPYGLKLTEVELPGLGHTAIRAGSPRALAALTLDAEQRLGFPLGYRHLAYMQTQIGFEVERDVLGLTGPAVERLYRRGTQWLAGAELGDPVQTEA